ncbi:MAG: hypothetical protein JXR37_30290 [Kiritimatiellae bacterium]|nr:hypothetical protein [Kiritimatiellia bacterium]
MHVASGDVHYVDAACTNATAPYTNWATAATVIQDAIDEAEEGDTVLVTDGVYGTGGRAVYNSFTNRVALTNAIAVESVNGPESTLVVGQGPIGSNAIRCAYVAGNAVLAGFTLTNGCTRDSGAVDAERSGGGLWCQEGAVVSNCTMAGNRAASAGGGAYDGTLRDCVLTGNSARGYGGGVYGGTLSYCTLIGNRADGSGGGACGMDDPWSPMNCWLCNCTLKENRAGWDGGGACLDLGGLENCSVSGNSAANSGGGVWNGTLYNCTLTGNSADRFGGGAGGAYARLHGCIVYYNEAPTDKNWSESVFDHCCTTPLAPGQGNVCCEPRLASVSHLAIGSPCVGAGKSGHAGGMDIDGEAWGDPPSIGCDELHPGSITGPLSVAAWASHAEAAPGFVVKFRADIAGRLTASLWDFGDGSSVSNRPYAEHAFSTLGMHEVVLTACNETYPGGLSATVTVEVAEQVVHYVSLQSPASSAPFTNWAAAATNIQDAVDAATQAGALVIVSNGVYDVGGKSIHGSMMNRVAADKAIALQSLNGPESTAIVGAGPLGAGAVRCLYLGGDAAVAGFTLSNGHTRVDGDWETERRGGGAWCEVHGAMSNCVLTGNSAYDCGGGSYRGIVRDCTFVANSVDYDGAGAAYAILYNCEFLDNTSLMYGGGAFESTLYHCTLTRNMAIGGCGGGADYCALYNCVLTENSANRGGGAAQGTLRSCTVTGNSAQDDGGGVFDVRAENSILYHNSAPESENWTDAALTYCCTVPLFTGGVGCIEADPLFVDSNSGDYRLQPASPCIDNGANLDWMTAAEDMDGNPRVLNGTVDMGAYETPFAVDLRVFLQGPYDPVTDTLSTALQGAEVPSNAPYAADDHSISDFPTQATDWVLVQLREEANGAVLCSRAGLLRNDGLVVPESGATGLMVSVDSGAPCYVAVKHRNHLGVMSAHPITFTNIMMAYDFTTNSSCYYGGTNACVELEPGVWGMIAGDADGDGKITWVDRAIASNQTGRSGYWCGDADLSGTVEGE